LITSSPGLSSSSSSSSTRAKSTKRLTTRTRGCFLTTRTAFLQPKICESLIAHFSSLLSEASGGQSETVE
uniref:Ovule protein n=1 Tax=Haemonchus placei TaxID=6290 RepID=A0A158QMX9_HAEPC